MKSILTILLLCMVLLWGCDTSSDLSLNTSEANTASSLSKLTNYELILLPEKSPLWMDSVFTVSKEIDGKQGGVVQMLKYYITESGLPFFMYVKLEIPKKAFNGTKTITMTVDNNFAIVHFYPEMNFSKSLTLNQYFQGIDLIEFMDDDYIEKTDFVYIDDDGLIEPILRNLTVINKMLGLIKVEDAELQHFSRYGWIRKD